MTLVITATFSVLRSTLDGVVFLIFCGCCFSTFILLWFKVNFNRYQINFLSHLRLFDLDA